MNRYIQSMDKQLEQFIEQTALRILERYEENKNQLFSIDEVAVKLKTSRQTIYRMIRPDKHGVIRLRPAKVGKHLKFSGRELDRLINGD